MAISRIIRTEDGSHTIFNANAGEHYHSVHGAIAESKHVFIEAGLQKARTLFSRLQVFEIGFGTGLNCLLTLSEGEKHALDIAYTALEPFPPEPDVTSELNYCSFPDLSGFTGQFFAMHQQPDGLTRLSGRFLLNRRMLKLEEALPLDQTFNLVYFDAFSAAVQPELWQPGIFRKIRNNMDPGGILVTYAAKGAVRRALQESGFTVERLQGPAGKREMLRANAS